MANASNQILEQLRIQINCFTKVNDTDWNMLLPHLSIRKITKHELMAKESKKSYAPGFLLEGMFRHYYTKDVAEKITYFFLKIIYSVCIMFPYKVLNRLYDKSMAWQKFGRLMAEYLAIGLERRMGSLL